MISIIHSPLQWEGHHHFRLQLFYKARLILMDKGLKGIMKGMDYCPLARGYPYLEPLTIPSRPSHHNEEAL